MCSDRVINHKHLVFLKENEEIVFHPFSCNEGDMS